MKLCFSSPHILADAKKSLRLSLYMVLLLGASIPGLTPDAGAAPKDKATPTPTPTPTPVATPTPTPTPAAVQTYSGTQQTQYITTARNAFVALRTEKSQPFLDAHKELDAAGGVSIKGLTTKEEIAARRALVAKASTANAEYLEFVQGQDAMYRAELAKTPLIPADVDAITADFSKTYHTDTLIKLRQTEQEVLKAGDDMLAGYDKRFGSATVGESGKVTFKKKADVSAMNALSEKFNAKVKELQPLRDELTTAAASASPTASPGATPVAMPSAAPVASPAAPAPTVSAATKKS